MSTVSINGQTAISAAITIPFYGPWSADVVLATTAAIPSSVTLAIGKLSLVGTVYRQSSFSGSRSVRIVGGAGGWRTTLPARGYSNAGGLKLSTVLGDAAREAKETISIPTDRGIGTAYVREKAKGERVLKLLTGGQWWIDPAGVTQLKTRDASAIATPFTVTSWSGGKGKFEIATEDYQDWLPGRTFTSPTVTTSQTISLVTVLLENGGKLRLHVLNTNNTQERMLANIRDIVRSEIAALSYSCPWSYTVASSTTTTVDATPDDPRMPGLTGVPLMPGLISDQLSPANGSSCIIQFVNADPARPVCTALGAPPLARSGDSLDAGYIVLQQSGAIATSVGVNSYFPGGIVGKAQAIQAAATLPGSPGSIISFTGGLLTNSASKVSL